MEIVDQKGQLQRSPEVVARLARLIEVEPGLEGNITGLVADPQRWGSIGLHYAARWVPTGTDILVKLHVSPKQRFWASAVAEREPDLAPRVLASGDQLGPIEIGWIVMERLPGGLHPGWKGEEFLLLLDAGVRFQKLARSIRTHLISEVTAVAGWSARWRSTRQARPTW